MDYAVSFKDGLWVYKTDAYTLFSKLYSAMTNYVNGEVLDARLPPETRATWVLPDGRHLCNAFDASGCRHWIEDARDG